MKTSATALRVGGPRLSVGIATADQLSLGTELEALDRAGLDIVHVDVMDGVFCPSLAGGVTLVTALPERFVRDVHLLVHEPLDKIDAFVEAGADILTFHVEATRHPHRVLQSLADSGVVRGVALNPGTPLVAVEPLLDHIDLLLLLAVNPGWRGQPFIASTVRRIAEARQLIDGYNIALAVDGGITLEVVARLAPSAVDLLVAGSSIYNGGDAEANAVELRDTVARTWL